jgi:hypothetical protein
MNKQETRILLAKYAIEGTIGHIVSQALRADSNKEMVLEGYAQGIKEIEMGISAHTSSMLKPEMQLKQAIEMIREGLKALK